jgi:hypothetical protein
MHATTPGDEYMCLTTSDELALQRNEMSRLKMRMAAIERRVPVQKVLAAQQDAIASVFADLRTIIEALVNSSSGMSTDAIARVCLAGRVPLEQAVRLAAKHYCQAARDMRAAEMHLADCKANSKFRPVFEDHCSRFRASLEEHRRLLLDLGVCIVDVAPGDPVDVDYMIVCDELETDNEASSGTVAKAHTPAFRFRDVLTNEQTIHAEVDVFVFSRRDDEDDPHVATEDFQDESTGEHVMDV